MPQIQNTVTEIKNALLGSVINWTWPINESVNFKLFQQRILKIKREEKNRINKNETQYIRTVRQLQRNNIC